MASDKFIPKLHVSQIEFTYSACEKFTKHRERIQKLREASDLKDIYKNKLGKASFAHDAAYSDSKDLTRFLWENRIGSKSK